jgi:hypothetical protein
MKMTQFLKWKADPSKGEVFTPIELVNEMLDNISESIWRNPESIFLDPCMGKGTFLIEIVRRLTYIYGYTEVDAKSRVYGYDVRVKYINHLQRRGFLNVRHKDFLSEIIKMKFDAVVGNPPFQDSTKTNSDKLWPFFIYKGFNLLKDNGVLSLITPDTWASGTKSLTESGRINFLDEIFTKYKTTQLRFDVKKFFPKQGVGFSSFSVINSPKVGDTNIINSVGVEFNYDIEGVKFLPKNFDPTTLDIIKKVIGVNSTKLYFKFYGKTKELTLSDVEGGQYIYKYSNTSSNHSSKWGDRIGCGYGQKKVIYAYMGSNQKFEYDLDGTISLMHNGRAWTFEENFTEESLKSFFESKLVKFINRDKWSQYNEPKILNMLPILDFTKQWSDSELYKYFNLTKEEIKYVESYGL